MYTCSSLVRRLTVVAALLALGSACDEKSGDELPPGATAADEVGRPLNDMELPVSLRNQDSAPAGAAQVEATTEQLRIDGAVVVPLEKGRVAEADQKDGTIPKLADKLRSPARGSVALRLAANLPYETAALVLNTAKQVGIHNAALQVRKTGASPETGWLSLPGFVMSSKADDVVQIPGTEERSWNDFTDNWQAVYDACREARTGSCAYVNPNFAKGGTLRIELMTSERGVNVNFFRRGLTPAQEKEEEKKLTAQLNAKKEDFLQGRITEEEMIEALLLGDPSTYALFQFRYQEALTNPSPLQNTMAPMCQGKKCGVVMVAHNTSPMVRVTSLLGAAFPDGTPAPAIAFEMPWTKKTPPADLAEFIAEQQAKEAP